MTLTKYMAVFCGARDGNEHVRTAARALMADFRAHGWGLVYGGGHVGLMGVFADALMELGGPVIGVIPDSLMKMEVAHTGLTELRVVRTMHERKWNMYEASAGFVVFPGGIGTLDEFFEILTWKQLGEHAKPIVLYNPDGYFDGLLAWFQRAQDEGLFAPEHMGLFYVHTNILDVADTLARTTAG